MSEQLPPTAEPVEIVRAWLNGESLECEVRAGVFSEPALWGSVLADLARYVAQGLKEEEGKDEAETLRAIREAFTEELKES